MPLDRACERALRPWRLDQRGDRVDQTDDGYKLGLVDGIDVADDHSVAIRLTLTSPMCPVTGSLPPEVETKVAGVAGVSAASVELAWDPPWNPSMMSVGARLELGFD